MLLLLLSLLVVIVYFSAYEQQVKLELFEVTNNSLSISSFPQAKLNKLKYLKEQFASAYVRLRNQVVNIEQVDENNSKIVLKLSSATIAEDYYENWIKDKEFSPYWLALHDRESLLVLIDSIKSLKDDVEIKFSVSYSAIDTGSLKAVKQYVAIVGIKEEGEPAFKSNGLLNLDNPFGLKVEHYEQYPLD